MTRLNINDAVLTSTVTESVSHLSEIILTKSNLDMVRTRPNSAFFVPLVNIGETSSFDQR